MKSIASMTSNDNHYDSMSFLLLFSFEIIRTDFVQIQTMFYVFLIAVQFSHKFDLKLYVVMITLKKKKKN